MAYPADLKYTKEHEWIRVEGDTGAIGITDFAQQQLGDVVYVELPEVGSTITAGQVFGTIESVKAVSELFAPVTGEVVATNGDLKDRPDQVNSKPHETWMVKVKLANPGEAASLMDTAAYEALIAKMKQVPFLDPLDTFAPRHIGPRGDEVAAMLKAVGAASLDQLIDEAIPASIRLKAPLDLPPAESESTYLARLKGIAKKNKVFRSFIGLGYADTLVPSVIRRNVFENTGWYTPYTPYQAEIAQGRLESLLNFQTMVTDLTGMAVANASLLDEGTAAGEAMTLLHRVQGKKLGDANGTFLVSDRCFPQTIAVLRSRAEPLGIELKIGPADQMELDEPLVFGALRAVSG